MAQPIVVQSPSQGITTGKLIAGGVIVIGTIYIGKKLKTVYDEWKTKGQLKADQQTTIVKPKGKVFYDVAGRPIQSANLASIAGEIQHALHPGWNKFTDKDRAVRAFQGTPFGYVKQLEQIYLDKYQVNLQQDMLDKLGNDFVKVKYQFR